jgi:lipopolysaccharide heptosyltransferase III
MSAGEHDRPAPPRADAALLVVIVARIGDTLLVTPMLRALKEACPRGRLTVLAHPKRLAVLEHLPFVDRLAAIQPRSAWLRGRLGGARHDLAFVFGRDRPLLDYALRVSERAVAFARPGLAQDARRLRVVPAPTAPMHAVRERLLLAEAVGVRARSGRLAYVVTAPEARWAQDWLARRGAGGSRPLVGLQTMSFPTKAHRNWPAASFAELAARIAARHPGARFVVLGDRDARAAGDELSRRLPGRVCVAAGETGLRESAALIGALDLYVGVDTGPTHIAGALDVPMIGIYHHAYPGRNLAPLERSRLRVLEQPASGALEIDAVMSAAEELLAETGMRA